MSWETFLSGCTARLWRLRVRSLKLDDDTLPPVRVEFPVPDDKDIPNDLARRGYPPGRYAISPKLRVKGEAEQHERNRIRLPTYGRVPSGMVLLTPQHCEAPAAARRASGSVAAAREARERAEQEAATATAQADRAEAIARAKKAERMAGGSDPTTDLLTQLIAKLDRPDNGLAALLPIIMQQQRTAFEAQLTMMHTMLEQQRDEKQRALEILAAQQQAPAREGKGALAEALGQLALLNELKDALADEIGGEKQPEALAWLREVKGVLAALPRAAGAHGPATAQAASAPAIPAATAPPDGTMAQERVGAVLRQILAEAAIGSHPEAVADRLADDVDLLPLPVRTALCSGDWSRVLPALAHYMGKADHEQLAAFVASSPAVLSWCGQFVVALRDVQDSPAEETA